ncbi:polysaccharide deacetylase family protein [Bacteroides sp. UBA939]|uniref:polysaccharide deacetylase family protein n=1 Tax=Bacteroides sp. UBA939 TaxID=1946092 RepID=UPI0025BD9D00|nr:polysaccharide deacetylase family protein [Bacteroides sp. UBA939]
MKNLINLLMPVLFVLTACTQNTTSPKLIALTFDDGPNTTTTVHVLEKLKKHVIPASFFVIGNNIDEESAKVLKQAFDRGCDIQNHSRTHSNMPDLSADEIKEEIKYTSAKIREVTGVEPLFFRPPYISVSPLMHEVIDLTFINGAGCFDWDPGVATEARAAMVLKDAADGGIILMHDMQGNQQTVDALDIIIPELKKQGFEFVTVTELFKRRGINPQKRTMYSNVAD